LHPVTGDAWVGNRAADTLTVVDARSRAVVANLDTGRFPFRVAFTPDGAHALVSCAEAGEVQVFDAKERKLAHAISIAADASEQSPLPMGLCVDPDRRFAFVACGRGEYVAILDLKENRVAGHIAARAGPDGIGFARVR
jgi:YVTN family beta-propeller protein